MAYFLCVCVYCPHSLSIFGGGDRIRCTGDPGPILYGAVFTGPFLILKIPFQQLRWIYIFSNARGGGQNPLGPFRRIASDPLLLDSDSLLVGTAAISSTRHAWVRTKFPLGDIQHIHCSVSCSAPIGFPIILTLMYINDQRVPSPYKKCLLSLLQFENPLRPYYQWAFNTRP